MKSLFANTTVILLAGGKGTRLRAIECNKCHKVKAAGDDTKLYCKECLEDLKKKNET